MDGDPPLPFTFPSAPPSPLPTSHPPGTPSLQAAGLVPIVEPEILIDGDHTIERFQEVGMNA